MSSLRQTPLVILTALALANCDSAEAPSVTRAHPQATAPPGAPAGSCWGQSATPAIVETVTDQVILQPAEIDSSGTVITPAIYKTETRQAIIRERRETWFRTPCADQLPADFTASLQRALKARGYMAGMITGEMDARTRRAIRRYQKPQGLDSDTLSLEAARQLGLVAVDRDSLPQ